MTVVVPVSGPGARELVRPEVALADAQYWNEQDMDEVIANKHIQVLVRPDSSGRTAPRPGWTGGRRLSRTQRPTKTMTRTTAATARAFTDELDGRPVSASPVPPMLSAVVCCKVGRVPKVIDLLSRPVYGLSQVDTLLGLRTGTARRWIDGYVRAGKSYPPVVREVSTGDEAVTWGEFVETRLLAQYRDAGVPVIRMRPAIDMLREQLQKRYPLASARTWLDVDGRELVWKVQDQVRLERPLALVVVRTGQAVLDWSPPADAFRRSIQWTDDGNRRQPRLVHPDVDLDQVQIDPLRGFGEPVVRNVRTENIVELFRSGESPEGISEMYELEREAVLQALRYEFRRANGAAAESVAA